jgi:hypothetical protein
MYFMSETAFTGKYGMLAGTHGDNWPPVPSVNLPKDPDHEASVAAFRQNQLLRPPKQKIVPAQPQRDTQYEGWLEEMGVPAFKEATIDLGKSFPSHIIDPICWAIRDLTGESLILAYPRLPALGSETVEMEYSEPGFYEEAAFVFWRSHYSTPRLSSLGKNDSYLMASYAQANRRRFGIGPRGLDKKVGSQVLEAVTKATELAQKATTANLDTLHTMDKRFNEFWLPYESLSFEEVLAAPYNDLEYDAAFYNLHTHVQNLKLAEQPPRDLLVE